MFRIKDLVGGNHIRIKLLLFQHCLGFKIRFTMIFLFLLIREGVPKMLGKFMEDTQIAILMEGS